MKLTSRSKDITNKLLMNQYMASKLTITTILIADLTKNIASLSATQMSEGLTALLTINQRDTTHFLHNIQMDMCLPPI